MSNPSSAVRTLLFFEDSLPGSFPRRCFFSYTLGYLMGDITQQGKSKGDFSHCIQASLACFHFQVVGTIWVPQRPGLWGAGAATLHAGRNCLNKLIPKEVSLALSGTEDSQDSAHSPTVLFWQCSHLPADIALALADSSVTLLFILEPAQWTVYELQVLYEQDEPKFVCREKKKMLLVMQLLFYESVTAFR